jgi:hypothetical protein
MERFNPNKLNAVASALFLASAALNGSIALDAHSDANRASAQAEVYEQFEGNEPKVESLRLEADSADDKSDRYVLITGLNLAAGGLFAASAGIGSAARRRRSAV